MLTPLDFPSYLNIALVLCITIGGFFAVRNGKASALSKFQKETIDAMQQRMDMLEDKVSDFEKENAVQRHIIDTITSALKTRGMIITIDGDMVTIEEPGNGVSRHRKRTSIIKQASITKKEEV